MNNSKSHDVATIDTFPKKGVHKYVRRFFEEEKVIEKNDVCLDCPAGDGRASYLLHTKGAKVKPYDLYPEFFRLKLEGVKCLRGDLQEKFPEEENHFDFIICEEGIEHLANQLETLREFNRILKMEGRALITTPSQSHIRARLSFLLNENEYHKRLPPNEVDSIWFSKEDEKLYYGHIFLMTAQKLRTLAILSGFKIEKVYWTDIGFTSVLLFPFLYPLIIVSNARAYFRAIRKKSKQQKKILKEVFLLNVSPKILLSKHLMFLMKKISSEKQTQLYLRDLVNKKAN